MVIGGECIFAPELSVALACADAPSYYGVNDGDVCGVTNGGPFPANWATDSGINDGYPFCTSKIQSEAKTLKQYNTNRIVAMNANMVSNDRDYWCGKEVQIFKDGKQIILDEGPFILMDGCAACTSASIIDLSAKAFTLASGGSCGNNPEGFTVKVIDNDLSHTLGDAPRGPATGSSVYNPPAGGDSPQQQAAETPAAVTPATVTPAAATPSSASKPEVTPIQGANLVAANPVPSPAAETTPAAEQPAVEAPAAESPAAAPAAPAAESPAAAASAAPADECTFGKWQCNGLQLQICNRKTQTSAHWETIANCASECSFTVTGSAVCQ